MGLEAVVEEIREKGKKEAEKIRAESKQETDKILAAAGKRAGEIKLAAEAESVKQVSHIIGQETSAVAGGAVHDQDCIFDHSGLIPNRSSDRGVVKLQLRQGLAAGEPEILDDVIPFHRVRVTGSALFRKSRRREGPQYCKHRKAPHHAHLLVDR